jgi:CheY-like chemotaxis protein
MLRLLIVDDNAHFLQTARDLLERQGLAVVALATTSAEAIRRARRFQPDVVLVDVELGDESGFDVARQLSEETRPASPAVLLISTYAEEDLADLIGASAAVGYLSKVDLSGHAIRVLIERAKDPRR